MALKKTSVKTSAKKNSQTVKVKVVKKAIKKDKQSRVEILQAIAEQTKLSRIDVERVFDSLVELIGMHMRKQGSGEFTIPKTGVKIARYKKPARKERTMLSPLIGEEVTIAAKPARNAVRLTALKPLKKLVE